MGRLGCDIDGHLNDSKFSEPMPWIGMYVAAASLACCLAMAADVFSGLRHRKLWFPCRCFSLNATSLTLIGVAIKFSVDLNTSMPRRQDQLAKLSNAVLICTVMGNSMPSLGIMQNQEIIMNIMALGLLVITLVVNICIQLGTGAIYIFWEEQAFIMFLMLLLLVILSFSALTVSTTKHYLETKYRKKHKLALKECSGETHKSVVEKLRGDLTKYWMMAHTSSPQFVMGRSVMCTASGAFCLLGAMTLAEAMIRSYLMPSSCNFCGGESDYKWSTTIVLIIQTIAVGVGTIAPAFRWFTAINFRCPNRGTITCKNNFKVESYWIQSLVELKECPLVMQIPKRNLRKCVNNIKIKLLDICISMQTGIVLMSRAVQLISIFLVYWLFSCSDCCKEIKRKLKSNQSISNKDSGSVSQTSKTLALSRFVLHLEGEEELVELMIRNNCDATDHWIQKGKSKQPKYLMQLLEKSTFTQGFKGVREFDSTQVPSLDSSEPPNSWVLPVVTLTSIAVALPNIDKSSIERLLCSVNEGLMYVMLVEKHLDAEGDLINLRKAADVVWSGVDLHYKWLGVDLRKMALDAKTPREILEELSQIAKNRFMEFQNRQEMRWKECPSKWPIRVLAANSLYRVSETLLLDSDGKNNHASDRLFQRLYVMIADLICACLTNLKHVISRECVCSAIEERMERVRYAVFLLGKTEKILKVLDQQALPILDADKIACIDKWRLLREQISFPFESSSPESDRTAFSSSEVHLSIK
ncbi:uncharacterized protein LOC131164786 [Malania oleifera]|uniref:uncharacterized protein LOC131164786 n=1 Tax=Malania oleifera TaxID=397392 RepID=UPI0025AE458E|nr:uncharacterized protein LOC131164786 [Malania oleifera]